MRRLRWLLVAVLIPVGITANLLVVCAWLGLWTLGNAALAVRQGSIPALSRAVDGAARTLGVASWVASGWGAAAGVLPPLEPSRDLGVRLSALSKAGLQLAPALPSALGMDGSRGYLVFALNDAEVQGSGGKPLSGMVVRLDRASPSIPVSDSVSSGLNPGNAPYLWDASGGLPWYRPALPYSLVSSGRHPDFPTAGRNMVTAWNTLGLPHVEGVITVDVTALAAVLRVTGPVVVEGYGEVTADNVLRLLLVDAYRLYPERVEGSNLRRQELNGKVQSAVIERLRDPRVALRAARALWGVVPSRHVQVYMADPTLQAVVAAIGADGALSRPTGDALGVFVHSDGNKLALFQEQHVERLVDIADDGSARVRQRVTFTNAVPEGLRGRATDTSGYLALTYRQRVAFRIPAAATRPVVTVEGGRALVRPEDTGPYPDSAGAQVLWQGQDIPPGEAVVTSVAYGLPPGTFGGPGSLRYTLDADPQPRAVDATVDLTVSFPDGVTPKGDGWTVDHGAARWSGTLDQPIELMVGE